MLSTSLEVSSRRPPFRSIIRTLSASYVLYNPGPYPLANATSLTYAYALPPVTVGTSQSTPAAITQVFPIPTTFSVVQLSGTSAPSFTVLSGGTASGILPSSVSQVNAIYPTFNRSPILPPSVSTYTLSDVTTSTTVSKPVPGTTATFSVGIDPTPLIIAAPPILAGVTPTPKVLKLPDTGVIADAIKPVPFQDGWRRWWRFWRLLRHFWIWRSAWRRRTSWGRELAVLVPVKTIQNLARRRVPPQVLGLHRIIIIIIFIIVFLFLQYWNLYVGAYSSPRLHPSLTVCLVCVCVCPS